MGAAAFAVDLLVLVIPPTAAVFSVISPTAIAAPACTGSGSPLDYDFTLFLFQVVEIGMPSHLSPVLMHPCFN
jgi:hypothetical protein